MPELNLAQWGLVVLAAVSIGLGKAGFAGFGMLAVLIMALVLPARESTGVVLPMLIVADVFAVAAFRKFTVWSHVLRLLPPAFLGVVTGWLLMPHIDDGAFGPLIGWITLGLLVLMLVQKLTNRLAAGVVEHPGIAWPMGWAAGVVTMLANAAGPIMAIYLLAARLPKYKFVGTAAWYFFIVNIIKVPFSASLGLIQPSTLLLNLALIPAIAVGIFSGRWLLGKINQTVFEWLMIGFSFLGALRLIW
jgi:uncharacterized protein